MATKVSRRGLVEIASHEGIVNAPYRDSVGVWTVGIGHTASAGSPDPERKRGEYSMSEIMAIFQRDIAKFEKRVSRAFQRELTQAQFDAAVSFDFNTGAILRATWVKKFNAGDMAGARKTFMDWRKPSEIIPRRKKEQALFFDGEYSSGGKATLYPATSAGTVLWGRGRSVDVLALMVEHPAKPSPKPVSKQEAPATTGTVKGGLLAAVAVAGAGALAWLSDLPCQYLNLFCGG